MILQSFGAIDDVTGSKHLLSIGSKKILVDCGLFQGGLKTEKKNWDELSFDPTSIDLILITHAHLDHVGFLPALFKRGLRVEIWATQQTIDLATIVLEDSANLMKDKEKPLYHQGDVNLVLKYFRPVEQQQSRQFGEIEIEFLPTYHILGASMVFMKYQNQSILFSGDLGGSDRFLHKNLLSYECKKDLDFLVVESTYGNRIRLKTDRLLIWKQFIQESINSNGKILVPVFAIDRLQEVIVYLVKLMREFPDFKIPIIVDSPMGIRATDVYLKNNDLLCEDLRDLAQDVYFVKYHKQLKKIENQIPPYILLSSSGMLEGGMVMNHLDDFISNQNDRIVMVGYQSTETLGHQILNGTTEVTINKIPTQVMCKISHDFSFSAHADQTDLLNFISQFKATLKTVVLVHGEQQSKLEFQSVISEKFNLKTVIMNSDTLDLSK